MSDHLYIGVMSGTSMDGIDTVLCSVTNDAIKPLYFHSEDFSPALRSELQSLALPGDNEIDRHGEAGVALAEAISQAVNNLLKHAERTNSDISAIGSHGQTIRHRPEASKPFSLQIGDPSTISQLTGITTVSDFRMADIAAGGQGAPLVPAFHHATFAHQTNLRVILNIGGIANITVIPPKSGKQHLLTGYDTGPGNMLSDLWIQYRKSLTYDKNGDWARSGSVVQELLDKLLDEPYFKQETPKSTGKELFNLDWLHKRLEGNTYQDADVQRTLIELSAITISDSIKQSSQNQQCDVFVCGGGVNNLLIMERLGELLPNASIASTAKIGMHPQWVEAAAFAWLAKQTLNRLPGNAPSVTGASQTKVLGGVYFA